MKNEKTEVSKGSTQDKKPVHKTETKKSAKTDKAKKPNRIIKFLKDLKSEVKKIVWPTKKQVVNNTVVVMIAMVVTGIFIWGLDSIFMLVFNLILQRK